MGGREGNFTTGRVADFHCPPGKQQAIFWDGKQPGLGLRVTANGARAYVFQGWLHGRSVRVTIGRPDVWPLETVWSVDKESSRRMEVQRGARQEAARLKAMVDSGINPAHERRARAAAREQEAAAREKDLRRREITVADAWHAYLADRRPYWGERHYLDHLAKAHPGGTAYARRKKKPAMTTAGPLACLMTLPLTSVNAAVIEDWAAREGKSRPASARLAWRLLAVFLRWCAEQPEYTGILPHENPAKTSRSRQSLGRPARKVDVLTREQLAAWFASVQALKNRTVSAALQLMLLTGARPGEVLALRWADINLRWKSLTIRDKVEGERVIPLTPYAWHLLKTLPREKAWVFAARIRAEKSGGRIATPNRYHHEACAAAGIDGLTLHGLRRSFASLTEWLEVPAGVVAQIQGHKPSATAEKHYKVRPLDLLRLHHGRIEAWLLEQAGISFSEEHADAPPVDAAA